MKKIFLFLYILPVLYFIYTILVYSKTRVPIIITPKKYYQELFKNIQLKNKVIYELGCGRGDFLFAAEKYEPNKIIGYELSLIHVIWGKILSFLKKSEAKIIHKNFFTANISDADFIYIFLVTPVVAKLWKKIKRECKPGTQIAVLSDQIPGEVYIKRIPTKPNNKKTTYYYIYNV